MNTNIIRTREEILDTFQQDIDNRKWLYWHLAREYIMLRDDDKCFTNWYQLVCAALDALRLKDYAELRRIIFQKMPDAL